MEYSASIVPRHNHTRFTKTPSRISWDACTPPRLFCAKCPLVDLFVGHLRRMGLIVWHYEQWNCRPSLMCQLSTGTSPFRWHCPRVTGMCGGQVLCPKYRQNGGHEGFDLLSGSGGHFVLLLCDNTENTIAVFFNQYYILFNKRSFV